MSSENNDLDYSKLAQNGIELMLNNRIEEAEKLFCKHVDENIQMAAGYSYLTFMNAVMSFEEEKIQHSIETLCRLERKCSPKNGWLLSVKNRFFGSKHFENEEGFQWHLEQQVILADCQVLLAILTFLQQEIGSYMKGGWALRRAWKVYDNSYAKIKKLYSSSHGKVDAESLTTHSNGLYESISSIPFSSVLSPSSITTDLHSTNLSNPTHTKQDSSNFFFTKHPSLSSYSLLTMKCSEVQKLQPSNSSANDNHKLQNSNSPTNISANSLTNISANSPTNISANSPTNISANSNEKLLEYEDNSTFSSVHKESIIQLMASVSFGYGLFQLCMSLLPPSLLRLSHMFGIQGDRLGGLTALMFTRKSKDMRAPLATLALLWYHTVVRPFFALDADRVQSGLEAAHLLLSDTNDIFANSALFLFFWGRMHRLQGDIPGALNSYDNALHSNGQRELQLLVLHEVGWCHLLQLQWNLALQVFASLKKDSRWCKSFYAYMTAVCSGVQNDIEESVKGLAQVSGLVRKNKHALEAFLLSRANKSTSEAVTRQYCLLRIIEVLYMWNTLGSCPKDKLLLLLDECQRDFVPSLSLRGLHLLLTGVLLVRVDSFHEGITCLKECVETPSIEGEGCIQAFAAYELGKHFAADKNSQREAKKWLLSARDDYNGYDFENRLTVRIHAALRTV